MQNYWGVEAAPQICLRFSFVARSFGVAVCWKSKDYWCQKEVPATSSLAIGETSIIITILIWCLPRICDNLLCSTTMKIIWLHIEGNQEDPSIPVIAHEVWELWTIHQESLYWRCEDVSLKGLNIHLRKDATLLGSGSSTSDLSKVCLHCETFSVTLCWNSKDYWCHLLELFWP